MGFGAIVKTIFTFLPELIGLVKMLYSGVKSGIEVSVLKNRVSRISKAFEPGKDPREAARELNDAFKK